MTNKSTTYIGNEKKVTVYCTVYSEAGIETQDDETGESVRLVAQKIRVHESGKEKLRFIYGRNKTVPKPLEIPEEELPQLFAGILEAGLLSKETVKKLQAVLAGSPQQEKQAA